MRPQVAGVLNPSGIKFLQVHRDPAAPAPTFAKLNIPASVIGLLLRRPAPLFFRCSQRAATDLFTIIRGFVGLVPSLFSGEIKPAACAASSAQPGHRGRSC